MTASDQTIFTKGCRLHIVGPSKFPFTLDAIVTRATHTTPQHMSSKRTTLKAGTGKLFLEHWRDTAGYSLAIPLGDGFTESIDVTIEEV